MEAYRLNFESSRELFEAAREAAIDAERCRRELAEAERHALAMCGPSLEPRVMGGNGDRVGNAVAALVDREAELHARVERDYALIDAACEVLYGRDGMSDGLAALMPLWTADAIYHRYLALRTWDETEWLVGRCRSRIRSQVAVAFDLMDANGMAATVEGRGHAEG